MHTRTFMQLDVLDTSRCIVVLIDGEIFRMRFLGGKTYDAKALTFKHKSRKISAFCSEGDSNLWELVEYNDGVAYTLQDQLTDEELFYALDEYITLIKSTD